nr:immunoglobulin heavy chain junction region [Macaca mulatta]
CAKSRHLSIYSYGVVGLDYW